MGRWQRDPSQSWAGLHVQPEGSGQELHRPRPSPTFTALLPTWPFPPGKTRVQVLIPFLLLRETQEKLAVEGLRLMWAVPGPRNTLPYS